MVAPGVTVHNRVEILAAFEAYYTDFDMMAEGAIGWDQKYEHIGRGRFEGSLSQAVLNTLQIGRERFRPGVMQRGSAPSGSWFIAFPIEAEGSLHVRGRQVEFGQPILVGPCEDTAFVANGYTDLVQTVLPVEQIERWMQIRRDGPGLEKKNLLRPWKMDDQEVVRRGNALAALLPPLLKAANGFMPSTALAAIEGQIVDVVLGMVPSDDVPEPLHVRARVALRLRDLLQNHIEAPLNISAMCETLGVKERTLYVACVEAFGRPPKTMLMELRLNAVRRALTQPISDSSVTAIASRYGFWHLGNFSAEYKRQFDELPSVTLAKTLGHQVLASGLH